MPLLKRKPYSVSKAPNELKPEAEVFFIRFTGEIFHRYEEYIRRFSLYRQRVWTCKATGKQGLTFEEAAISEQKASEQVAHFPKEYIGPVLKMVQFKQIRLEDLVDTIHRAFKDVFVEEEVVTGQREGSEKVQKCRILKVIDDGLRYEVGWLGSEEEVTSTSEEPGETLSRRRHPLPKNLLKAFIRESTILGSQKNAPWVVLEKLAHKHGIETEPPLDIAHLLETKRRRRPSVVVIEEAVEEKGAQPGTDEEGGRGKRKKRRKVLDGEDETMFLEQEEHRLRREESKRAREERLKEDEERRQRLELDRIRRIRYPIEDTLVRPLPDDPPLDPRPIPSRDFAFPEELVADLLMMWDFLGFFSKTLHLSPYNLDELEAALEYREAEVPLLAETHHALLLVCLEDPEVREGVRLRARRATEMTVKTWALDLCNYIEARNLWEFLPFVSPILRGHYRTLDKTVKLRMLVELTNHAVLCEPIRRHLEESCETVETLRAQRRDEEVEEKRQKREAELAGRAARRAERLGTAEAGSSAPSQAGSESWRNESEGAMNGYEENDGAGDEDGMPGGVEEEDWGEEVNQAPKGKRGKRGRGRENGVGTPWSKGLWRTDSSSQLGSCDGGGEEAGDSPFGGATGDSPTGGGDSCLGGSSGTGMTRAQLRLAALHRRAAEKVAEEEERRRAVAEDRKVVSEKRRAIAVAVAERRRQEAERLEKLRKAEHFEREIERHTLRSDPLGLDKDFNRYWFFAREGRIFVELQDAGWGYYGAKEEVDQLYSSLNPKGIRERSLQKRIEAQYTRLSSALAKRSREFALKVREEENAVRRSSRVRSAPKMAPFMSYVNKYAAAD